MFSLQDLKNFTNGAECWDSIMNNQAWNFMRGEMQLGDGALFYHSFINTSVVWKANVFKEAYPDNSAWGS